MRTDIDGLISTRTHASLSEQERFARELQGMEMRRLFGQLGNGLKKLRHAASNGATRMATLLAASTQARADKIRRDELYYE